MPVFGICLDVYIFKIRKDFKCLLLGNGDGCLSMVLHPEICAEYMDCRFLTSILFSQFANLFHLEQHSLYSL